MPQTIIATLLSTGDLARRPLPYSLEAIMRETNPPHVAAKVVTAGWRRTIAARDPAVRAMGATNRQRAGPQSPVRPKERVMDRG
jgi:hypothetical protein